MDLYQFISLFKEIDSCISNNDYSRCDELYDAYTQLSLTDQHSVDILTSVCADTIDTLKQ